MTVYDLKFTNFHVIAWKNDITTTNPKRKLKVLESLGHNKSYNTYYIIRVWTAKQRPQSSALWRQHFIIENINQ